MVGEVRADDGAGFIRIDFDFAKRLAFVFDVEPQGVIGFQQNCFIAVLEALPVHDLVDAPFLRCTRSAQEHTNCSPKESGE